MKTTSALNYLVLMAFILVLSFSCTTVGDSSAPINSIYFKLNGEENLSLTASGFKNEGIQFFPNVPPFYNVGVSSNINGLPFSLFQLTVSDENIPAEGNYDRAQGCSAIQPNCIFIQFARNVANENDEPIVLGNEDNSTINTKFTKLEYTSNGQITGEFSASGTDSNGDKIEITEGTFNVTIR